MKKKTMRPRNITVYAVNEDGRPGFEIYVNLSGKNKYLMHNRHNGLLYEVLKDGVTKEELDRFGIRSIVVNRKGSREQIRRRKTRLQGSVEHLRHVLDECLTEYEAVQAAA